MPTVKRGHAILGISDADILFGAGDSFAAESDARRPTDISLLRDAARALIIRSKARAQKRRAPGNRKTTRGSSRKRSRVSGRKSDRIA